MKRILLALIFASFLLAGCIGPEEGNGNGGGDDILVELVETGDSIKVEYRGSLEDGEVFDSSERQGLPLEFEAGLGRMIKGFDEAVIGMKLNEEKTVTISPDKGYGFSLDSKIVEIPRENINVDWNALEVGTPISSNVAGNGVVIEKKENVVIVDFNHKLAGKTLIFWIKVVSIEKA